MKKKYKYIIGWDELNPGYGGQIVLYYLCHLLNEIGETSYMKGGDFPNVLGLNCPIRPKELDVTQDDVIVIYPEVINGNPMNAKNVARWILYTIGVNGGSVDSHKDSDLIFGYQEEYSGNGCTITKENKVTIFYNMTNIYKNKNQGSRPNSCYIMHKGFRYGQVADKHPSDSIFLEGKSHQEISDIFNKCHTFYCYDPHTYYSTYAALCGCNSIIIPPSSISKSEWKKDERDTYGIAYGESDLPRAIKTLPLLHEYINDQNTINIQNVNKFVNLCENHFK